VSRENEGILYGMWFNRKILNKETNESSKNVIRETLEMWIEQADKNKIPFKLQNIAIMGGENELSWTFDILPKIRKEIA
jgi:hypothetical protein